MECNKNEVREERTDQRELFHTTLGIDTRDFHYTEGSWWVPGRKRGPMKFL